MPNIEFHGLKAHQVPGCLAGLKVALRGSPLAKDVVITDAHDEVVDIEGESRPFLRVIFAKHDNAEACHDCMDRLATLNMEIEMIVIQQFISKKK